MTAEQWTGFIVAVFSALVSGGYLSFKIARRKLPAELYSLMVAQAKELTSMQSEHLSRLEADIRSLQAQINTERQAREREVARAWERVMLGHTYAEELRAHINSRREPPPPAYPEGWSAPWFAPTPSPPNPDQ